jgi:hypothetical protein
MTLKQSLRSRHPPDRSRGRLRGSKNMFLRFRGQNRRQGRRGQFDIHFRLRGGTALLLTRTNLLLVLLMVDQRRRRVCEPTDSRCKILVEEKLCNLGLHVGCLFLFFPFFIDNYFKDLCPFSLDLFGEIRLPFCTLVAVINDLLSPLLVAYVLYKWTSRFVRMDWCGLVCGRRRN